MSELTDNEIEEFELSIKYGSRADEIDPDCPRTQDLIRNAPRLLESYKEMKREHDHHEKVSQERLETIERLAKRLIAEVLR